MLVTKGSVMVQVFNCGKLILVCILMLNLKKLMLTVSYHCYIVTSFQVGDVRLKCLQSLLPLYQTEELGPKMELFTNKFKVRNSMALRYVNSVGILNE